MGIESDPPPPRGRLLLECWRPADQLARALLRALNAPRSGAGQLVRTLEEWLGAPLFHRGSTGRARLVLTEAAQQALPDIRAGFDRLS
ncbi:MAG TPA: LysR family transcriptional regulator, partial [Phenylobacterium sp.]|uniref:LysR family transcriptional regulator n=1 Tax=Phenylobacterium sp. TaxID=1871053 RepID=UPI002F938C17